MTPESLARKIFDTDVQQTDLLIARLLAGLYDNSNVKMYGGIPYVESEYTICCGSFLEQDAVYDHFYALGYDVVKPLVAWQVKVSMRVKV